MQQQVFFVGTQDEVGHHAAPLSDFIPYKIVEPETAIDKCQPGDLAIFYSEHFDRFRNAIGLLKQNHVATLYMIDGILEWRNAWENRPDEPACPFTMRPILCHKAACIGHSQARTLNSWGNVGITEVVGVPRFDGLAKLPQRNRRSNGSNESNPKRILVMTAKCPSFTEGQNAALRNSLFDIKNAADANGDIDFVWRLTANWEQELEVENQLTDLSGQELANVLQEVDAVITTPSTAAIEAMLLDIPTAILDYNNSPRYVRAAWNIHSANHIQSEIQDVLCPPESKLNFQRQVLAEELLAGTNATNRMTQLVKEMLSHARDAIENGHPLAFPNEILPAVQSNFQNASFRHADAYQDFAEFQIDDRIVLQAQLAHSRREITHLQNQLNQIQSELNHAHKIFDEINNHPIAGPIVKLRRKISDIIAKLKHSSAFAKTN